MLALEISTERDEVCNTDPRTACLTDFRDWANKRMERGDRLVVLSDTNQSLHDTKEAYNLNDLVEECNLISTMERKHPGESLKSLDRGSKTIDHILVTGVDGEDITQASQLPFGLSFHTDHRGEFVNMDGDSMLNIRTEEPEHQEGRQISSKNGKHRKIYLEEVNKNLEAHNVYESR